MKTLLVLLSVLAAASLTAQPVNQVDHPLRSQLFPAGRERLMVLRVNRPNEIAGRKVTYSGAAVQMLKNKGSLQLLNPAAPDEYFPPGEGNLDRDIMTHEVTGFKLFSINF